MGKTNKNPYDFGKWNNIPESYNEITFQQLCDINRLRKKTESKSFNIFDSLEILTGHKRQDIENLPYEFLELILNRMVFLKTELPKVEPKPYIEVNGTRYISNVEEKLTVAEYASIDTILRTDEDDLVSIIAILFRLPNERYDEDFELNKFEERKKMFGNLSCLKVLSAIGFFLKCWLLLEAITKLSSEVEEGINNIADSIKNCHSNGDFKNSYMTRHKILRKLKKLKKQI